MDPEGNFYPPGSPEHAAYNLGWEDYGEGWPEGYRTSLTHEEYSAWLLGYYAHVAELDWQDYLDWQDEEQAKKE